MALEEALAALQAKAIAVLIGPSLAMSTRTLVAAYPFLGTFGALTAIYLMAFVLLTFLPLKAQPPAQVSDTVKNHPYRQLYSQPLLILITVVSAAGYTGWYSVNVAGLATGIVILIVMFLLRHSMDESPAEKAAA